MLTSANAGRPNSATTSPPSSGKAIAPAPLKLSLVPIALAAVAGHREVGDQRRSRNGGARPTCAEEKGPESNREEVSRQQHEDIAESYEQSPEDR